MRTDERRPFIRLVARFDSVQILSIDHETASVHETASIHKTANQNLARRLNLNIVVIIIVFRYSLWSNEK